VPLETLHIKSGQSLAGAAAEVFGLLGVERYQEHESDSYPGGSYFKGEKDGLTFKVSVEDDVGYDDYQYWVVVSTGAGSGRNLVDEVERVAAELSRAGLAVSRGPGPNEESDTREVYSLDPAGRLVKRREPVPS
jgi:hypothetical protein